MEVQFQYLGKSQLVASGGGQLLSLAPNLARDKVAFDAPLLKPTLFREAISALHDVVINDLRFQPRDKTAYEAWKQNEKSRLANLRAAEYKQARDIAGDVISLRDAIDFGADLLNPKTTRYDVSKTVKGMSASELSAVKQGLRAQLDEVMANTKAALSDRNQDAREMVKPLKDMLSRAGRQKLEIILGDQSKEFLRQLDEVYSAALMRAAT